MILYIAGPMTGLPEFNYPAFNEAERALRAKGYDVLNPATHKPDVPDPGWVDYMRLGIAAVCRADGVALLPDWPASTGATLERRIAITLGLDVRDIDGWPVVDQ